MKKTDLRGKTYVVPVAIAASFSMAGVGLVSDGVVMADVTSITDTLSVAVNETCTFKNTSDAEFTGSALNGNEVENFNDSGVHTFYLFCNNNDGYTVSATPYDLEATGTDDVISYTENYTHTGANGMWTAAIATSESGVTVTTPVPAEGGVILSSGTHSSDSMSFTATYSAYVGTRTSAGTYTGTIHYTLSSLNGAASNSGNGSGDSGGSGDTSGSGDTGDAGDPEQNGGSGENSGDSGTDSGSEVTDNSGAGDSGSGKDNSGSGDSGSGGSSAPQSAAPTALNNTYNTYNTTNTYNTSYPSGGASTPAVASTQDTTGENSGNTKVSDSYEQPLGVTTSTVKSSSEDSGIDFMPMVVTGAALAVTGAAAVAVALNKKEKEKE